MRLCCELRACRRSLPSYRPAMPNETPPLSLETLARMSDQELITEWSKTTWEDGDPRMDALSTEVERRGLDF